MYGWTLPALLSAIALIVAGRALLRALAIRKAVAGTPTRGDAVTWITGRVTTREPIARWLSDDDAAWIERSAVIEILPRPGRPVVDARFQSNDTIVEERTRELCVETSSGDVVTVDVPSDLAIDGARSASQRASSVAGVRAGVREIIERAAPDLTLDGHQRIAVDEAWLDAGEPVLIRGRVAEADGGGALEVREVSVIEVGDPRRAVRTYLIWACGWVVVCAGMAAVAAYWAALA